MKGEKITPFRSQWVANLIKSVIKDLPGKNRIYALISCLYIHFTEMISNFCIGMPAKDLGKLLQPFGYEYAFTDSIIQDAQAKAKLNIFGNPEENVKYANAIAREMKEMGHMVEMLFSKRSKILSKLGHVVLAEEDYCRKYDGETPLAANECAPFVEKWKRQHASQMCEQLGLKDGPQFEFLSGILFVPSTTRITVPLMQNVSVVLICLVSDSVIIILIFDLLLIGNPS